jgi:alpha-D-xyloside xylohydrolase
LPAGTTWSDAWTGEALMGGQWVNASAPLDRIPLYLRAGASLPIRA